MNQLKHAVNVLKLLAFNTLSRICYPTTPVITAD